LMEYRDIAPGVKVPTLGLGTWGMGGRQIEDHRWDEEHVTAIRMAIELGLTHIDTAEYYGAGHTEELVGEAAESYERSSLFITTKVWRTNLRSKDFLNSVRQSLKRLNMDYVDLLLVHWPNPEIPLRETMEALELCAKEGYTRLIGVSNFSWELFREAQGYLRDSRLVANQVEYSLVDQKPKVSLLPYMQREGATLIAYSPLGKGVLSRLGNKVLDEMAKRYDKTQAQVALNWLISQGNVVAIPKSSNPVHLLDIVGALDWRLKMDDALTLADAFV
jgi:diketogulonate reductase-like aldo/keto reductase